MRSFQASAAVAMAAFTLAAAQNSSSAGATPSVNLFINDDLNGDAAYAASIVTAFTDATVYAIRCTSGPALVGSSTCGPNAVVVTVTEGPSIYMGGISTQIDTLGVQGVATGSESCALQGTTAADCHASVYISAEGQSTSTAIESTLTGTDYHRFNVAITGGATKTASPSGSYKSGAMATADSRAIVAMAAVCALSLVGILAL
ncbi:hypothetical protein OIDMADRAFT_183587 [Oidiodendron maius Zn]|uniref:Uncharacterized protein n=1 Tax=Oidiodendron maius (strain Zn) TaxID=913774 RepID=A0A0C3D2Q8_OIDMZ|nr:hypothetical protein OIDMADRAFT_183587 [Oidiodendron maius Zn]